MKDRETSGYNRGEERENALEHPLLKGFSTGTAHWRGSSDCCCCSCRAESPGDLLWPDRVWHPKNNNPRLKVKALHRHPLCNPFLFFEVVLFLGDYCIMFPLCDSHLNTMIPSLRQIPHECREHYSIGYSAAFQMLLPTRGLELFTQRVNSAPWKISSKKFISPKRSQTMRPKSRETR